MLLPIFSLQYLRGPIRAITVALVLYLICRFFLPQVSVDETQSPFSPWLAGSPVAHSARLSPLPVPDEYNLEEQQSRFCEDRFSTSYLADLRNNSFQYCSPSSTSSLTCFHSHTAGHNEVPHSFCVGKKSVLSGDRFHLGCNIRGPGPDETSQGMVPLDNIRQYWYDTGPKYIFDNFIDFGPRSQAATSSEIKPRQSISGAIESQPRRFTLLLKREGEGNLWHCLMEIWSMSMTMDVLRMSPDPEDYGSPYFRVPEDLDNTQVVILDEREDGPYFDLWKLFSGRDPIRLKQIIGNPEAVDFFNHTEQRIILPLAGASNPVWQNDWIPRDCTRSATLRAFVHRVLQHYQIPPSSPQDVDPNTVTVTFIDRKDANTRRLKDQDSLLAAVKAKYPDVQVQAVDFGRLSFPEQLRIAQCTDILAGIHGAGLTHTMFLREAVTSVVEIQPIDMGKSYMGFRNLANMRGISYFKTYARPTEDGLDDKSKNDSDNKNNTNENGAANEQGEGDGNKVAAAGAASHAEDEASVVARHFLSRRGSWHTENFEVDPDVFVQVMGAAIQSVYNKNLHQHEVAV